MPFSPRLSVIVPAHDGAGVLRESLPALRASDLPSEAWELIVVDDGSTDATSEVAERWADQVLRCEAPARGPAFARNRGGEAAAGDVLVFVDADVCVHPDALRRLADRVSPGGEPVAAFGAYDTRPAARGFVSRYRNLLHHYVHVLNAGEADTFWAGLGAVGRQAFRDAGGFDEVRYPRPQIEDIELGYRLRARGHRIVLDPDVRGTHLKRWTLRQMVRNDLLDRGVPWMMLLLERRSVGGGTLNIDRRERLLTLFAVAGGAGLVLGIGLGSSLLAIIGLGSVAAVLVGNASLLRWFARVGGPGFALAVVPLRLLYYVLNGLSVGLALVRHFLAPLRGDVPEAGSERRRGTGRGEEDTAATGSIGRRRR